MRRLLWKAQDWWELTRPELVCRVIGHSRKTPRLKLSGAKLCRRCSTEVGRWGV